MWGILIPDEAHGNFSNSLTDAGDVVHKYVGKIYDAFPLDLNSSCILMNRIDLGYGYCPDSGYYPRFKWLEGYRCCLP